MNGRIFLEQTLVAALPEWQVVSDARAIDKVKKPGAAVLWTNKRKRMELNGFNWLQDEVVLWVLSASDSLHVEDDLDDLLNQVLEVIEPVTAFTWEEAERGVLADTWDGWRITVNCAYEITN